ncbi:nucleotide exchange factor GrpE [Haloplanus sp. GCM10025708]|uniref:nucleotide exchange factor GrpE n=1 Tax=Haloferacaceae TaxID=1644056 RepID=UPI00361BEE62
MTDDAAEATDARDAEQSSEAADGEEASLAARVAEHDESLAAAVESLEARVTDLERELEDREEQIDDLESRLKRKQADFENYKKRAKKRQEQLKERATEDLIEQVVSVRDDLVRALDQDEAVDVREGLEATLKEFDHVLEAENVTPIEPEAGEEVDPQRHEVMMRVESDQPEGTVVDVFRPGYEMADKVVRTAQVTVSSGE